MNIADVAVAVSAVAGAAGFLLWRVASGKAQTACHPAKGAQDEPVVVVGAGLARGLKAAQKRARA